MSSLPPDQSEFHELPETLIADLRTAHVPRVPELIDAQILSDARAGFSRRRQFRLALRGAVAAAAAAAVVLIALPLVRRNDSHVTTAPVTTQFLSVVAPAEDVDRSGKVDILDAFVVARLIEVGNEIDQTYDVNGDGKVDQADVDRIAVAAVDTSTTGGGHVQ